MKKTILFGLLIASTGLAAEVKIERFEKVSLCFADRVERNSTQLWLGEKAYLIDILNSNKGSIRHVMDGNYGSGKCVQVTVSGYRVRENGHYPDLAAVLDVFKVMDLRIQQ